MVFRGITNVIMHILSVLANMAKELFQSVKGMLIVMLFTVPLLILGPIIGYLILSYLEAFCGFLLIALFYHFAFTWNPELLHFPESTDFKHEFGDFMLRTLSSQDDDRRRCRPAPLVPDNVAELLEMPICSTCFQQLR